jgi:hypothetical protein
MRDVDRILPSMAGCSRAARGAGLPAVLALWVVGLGPALLPAAVGAQDALPSGITIDGPPPPVAPAVLSRDSRGRVTLRAVRVEAPLRIDGQLDEPVYATVEPITDFIQQDPQEGQPASEPTHMWLLYDDEHLYITARCHDSQPHRIVANDMRREGRNVTQNDNISIIIDTFYDRRNGYEFLINAVGGMVDNQITDERDINRDWNTVWYARTSRDEGGWTVEVAIPFRSLRYRSGGPQVWGINLRRTIRWKNEFVYVSPVPRTYGPRGILRLSSAATLVGFEAPPAARNLEIKPYVLSGVSGNRLLQPTFEQEFEPNAGVDLKYGLTRSLTADLTYRTDFAQVEDDDQQVNLTRFTLFFPEKRDFFLEGQGIFGFGGVDSGAARTGRVPSPTLNTPVLFFSRRIGLAEGRPVPIEGGGRMTGKVGPYSIGLLDVQTDDEPAVGARSTNFAVARIKRDIFRRSYVGFVATRRSPDPAAAAGTNVAFGADASLWLSENVNVLGYFARTDTPALSGRQDSHRVRFEYDVDLYGLQAERLAVGDDFRPEVGFLRRSGFIQHFAQGRVSRRPRASRLVRKLNFESAFDYITDMDGRVENRQLRAAFRTDFHTGDAALVELTHGYEFVPASFRVAGIQVPVGAYRSSTALGSYTLGSQHRVSGELLVARGGFYGGDRTEAGYRGRIEVNERFSIEPGISVNWLDLPLGSATATLLSARQTFSFTPTMWLGALLQYNSTTDVASTNVRFRWEYRPGSDLFVVYSDGRDTLQRGRASTFLSRAFTVKATRLIRF